MFRGFGRPVEPVVAGSRRTRLLGERYSLLKGIDGQQSPRVIQRTFLKALFAVRRHLRVRL
jgi:hypothetical protein